MKLVLVAGPRMAPAWWQQKGSVSFCRCGRGSFLSVRIRSDDQSLLTTNNLPTVAKKTEIVNKSILKEERSHLSLVFSKHLAYFTPNLGIIKLGILDKKHKKPCIYCHGSYLLEASTNSINNLVECKLSEPAIGYATVLKQYTAYLWQIAATYPDCTIDLYDNGVSGAFPQCTHHPDIARDNTSLHGTKMIVSVTLHFGGSYGWHSWEPPAQARCFLAQWMYLNTDYQEEMNKEALDLMELPDEDDATHACIIQP